jgi:HPt (histidine-containing phosphotransfer) domain-containing protein
MNTLHARVAAVLLLAMAQDITSAAPTRAERQQWQALAVHLQLTDAQALALAAQRNTLDGELQAMARQAKDLEGTAGTGSAAALAELCERAQQRVAVHRQGLRQLLTPPQQERLQQLDLAFSLMPLVEAAQSAGLMNDRLSLRPPGMPSGAVEVEQTWQRMPAPALPGCQGTRLFRELDQPDSPGQIKRLP